jgi:hypothetical protein
MRARVALAVLAVAEVADVASTLRSLAAGNVETNPLLAHAGASGFILSKAAALIAVALILARFPSRRLSLVVFVGAVVTFGAAGFNAAIS